MADTMIMNNTVCNVVYIEAGGTGDGTTPATPLGAFPAIGSLVSSTVFIIRRNDTTGVTLPSGSRSDLDNVYFVGMPHASDWIYGLVPETVRTSAWNADADEYARVELGTYNAYLLFRPIIHAGMHGCWVVRMNPTGGHSHARNQWSTNDFNTRWANIQFTDTSTNNDGCYFFTNNRTSDDGIDLTNPLNLTNCSNFGITVAFTRGKYLMMRDNIFEMPCNYNDYWSDSQLEYTVYVNTFENLDMCNNTLWIQSTKFYSSDTGHPYGFYVVSPFTLNYIANSVKLIVQNSAAVTQAFDSPVYINDFSNGVIKDVDIAVSRYNGTNNQVQIMGPATMYLKKHDNTSTNDSVNKLVIKNLSSNTDNIWYHQTYNMYLYLHNSQYGGEFYTCDLNDLSAINASTGGIGTSNGTGMYVRAPRQCNTVQNITAYNEPNIGLNIGADKITDRNNCSAVFKNAAVKGKLYVYNCPFIEITSVTDMIHINTLLIWNYSSVIYIGTTTYDRTSWLTANWLWEGFDQYGSQSPQTFIDNSSLLTFIQWNNNPVYWGGAWMNNVAGVTGNWNGSNSAYTGVTHSTYRSGGGAASIKLSGSLDSRTHLDIGPTNFKGLLWTPPATGDAFAKFYLAHVDNPPSAFYLAGEVDIANVCKRIRGEVWVPYLDSEDVVRYKIYASCLAGMWETDTISTWNTGGEPVIQRVCTVPFKVTTLLDGEGAAMPVQFRFKYDLYSSRGATGAYTYLDPIIVFNMV